MDDSRSQIKRIKQTLRAWSVSIEDHPNDEEIVNTHVFPPAVSSSAARPNNTAKYILVGILFIALLAMVLVVQLFLNSRVAMVERPTAVSSLPGNIPSAAELPTALALQTSVPQSNPSTPAPSPSSTQPGAESVPAKEATEKATTIVLPSPTKTKPIENPTSTPGATFVAAPEVIPAQPNSIAVAAGQQFSSDQLDVFAFDANGQLNVSWVRSDGQCQGPKLIPRPNLAPPGAAVTALKRTDNLLDAYFFGNHGSLYGSSVVDGNDWSSATPIF